MTDTYSEDWRHLTECASLLRWHGSPEGCQDRLAEIARARKLDDAGRERLRGTIRWLAWRRRTGMRQALSDQERTICARLCDVPKTALADVLNVSAGWLEQQLMGEAYGHRALAA